MRWFKWLNVHFYFKSKPFTQSANCLYFAISFSYFTVNNLYWLEIIILANWSPEQGRGSGSGRMRVFRYNPYFKKGGMNPNIRIVMPLDSNFAFNICC